MALIRNKVADSERRLANLTDQDAIQALELRLKAERTELGTMERFLADLPDSLKQLNKTAQIHLDAMARFESLLRLSKIIDAQHNLLFVVKWTVKTAGCQPKD